MNLLLLLFTLSTFLFQGIVSLPIRKVGALATLATVNAFTTPSGLHRTSNPRSILPTIFTGDVARISQSNQLFDTLPLFDTSLNSQSRDVSGLDGKDFTPKKATKKERKALLKKGKKNRDVDIFIWTFSNITKVRKWFLTSRNTPIATLTLTSSWHLRTR
jgi:hypothetical protein